MYPIFIKYRAFDEVLIKVKKIEYGDKKCKHFSETLNEELNKIGIQSEIVIGESPKTLKEPWKHAWVGVWIEPQTGLFTKGYEK